MGILCCCFRSPTVDHVEDEVSDHDDDVTNVHDSPLGRGAVGPTGEKGFENHQQKEPAPEPEPVLESDELIVRKSLLHNDGILSRDEECPICFEGDGVSRDELIVKF
ncbi:hypothetical protein QVD17_20814 [Tagetes erecta]|uniref:Uncharacterized protein n=1 Tax=Tagetes erecta TaxID=13708 RepID=A0AAD8NYA4_TARER|nr:hypothetical protein QVD17_20814 [Tagetes erecta]